MMRGGGRCQDRRRNIRGYEGRKGGTDVHRPVVVVVRILGYMSLSNDYDLACARPRGLVLRTVASQTKTAKPSKEK